MGQRQLTVRMSPEHYEKAMEKARIKYGVPLSTIVKMFIHAFVSQKGMAFMVADELIAERFESYLKRKQWEASFGKGVRSYGPRLKDLYKF